MRPLLIAFWTGLLGIGGCSPAVSPGLAPTPLSVLTPFDRVASMEYVSDGAEDYWQSPAETLERQAGDCEDKALLLQHLLRADGLDADVVFGVEDARRSMELHAWVEYAHNGECYVLDPTNGFIGRRRNLSAGRHMPVLGMPQVIKRLGEYCRRTGATGVNQHYEYILARRAREEARVAAGEQAGPDGDVASNDGP